MTSQHTFGSLCMGNAEATFVLDGDAIVGVLFGEKGEAHAASVVRACLAHEELLAALRPLASVPLEEFGWVEHPEKPIHGWNDHKIYVRDVLAARAVIKKAERL
jgi:hypothetical protein